MLHHLIQGKSVKINAESEKDRFKSLEMRGAKQHRKICLIGSLCLFSKQDGRFLGEVCHRRWICCILSKVEQGQKTDENQME